MEPMPSGRMTRLIMAPIPCSIGHCPVFATTGQSFAICRWELDLSSQTVRHLLVHIRHVFAQLM